MNYNPCHSVSQIDSLSNKDRRVETDTDFTHSIFFYSRHILTNLDIVEYGQPLKCTIFGIPNFGLFLHL